ncbi:hypothetical protein DFQ27_008528 [Actinomortierella ambigua]|uniref:C2H2-type domain-containing protein n=1 Tax=Actinomortierella ambigua TaxID=1343610 RepID=A0A9P6QIW7_9FUNG|nr:hypothetical protein DFQ27_008528 [Actinomortierella ambigua]
MAPVSERLALAPSTLVEEHAEVYRSNGSSTGAMAKDDDLGRTGSSVDTHMDIDEFHPASEDAPSVKIEDISSLKVEDGDHQLHDASSVATSDDDKDDDDDDDEDNDNDDENDDEGDGSMISPEDANLRGDSVACRWKDCSQVLPSLSALVIHLSDDHIGWKKTSYTCEWQGCSRRPIAQTTRFALISHMRSHTKHKPYDCPVPECDKSFSRSDAMAKHLRCQHGDVPERFTGRKSRGRYTMRNPTASSTLLDSVSRKRRYGDDKYDSDQSRMASGRRRYGGGGGGRGRRKATSQRQEESEESGEDSDLAIDNGQSLKERYGILKAKYRYIANERDSLGCDYVDAKKKMRRLQVEREVLLDALAAQTPDLGDNLDAIEDSEEE